MLRKISNTTDPVRLPLVADEELVKAQFIKARELIKSEIEDNADNEDMFAEMMAVVRSTVGESDALHLYQGLESAAQSLIEKNFRPAQMKKAVARLKKSMKKEETREARAFVRAQIAIQRYRETSDVNDLLTTETKDATWVTLRGISGDERRAIERRVGHKPRKGALLASRAFDVLRRATREGEDSQAAYATFLSELSQEDLSQVEKFEDWSVSVDRETARVCVVSIDGFEYGPSEKGYPVEKFLIDCVEADEVISEVSRHIRNLATLGKSASLRQPSTSTTEGQGGEAAVSETDGSAASA